MSKVKILDRNSQKSVKRERELLSKLHHPFIVNMLCTFQDYENLYLVMDLLTGGDLRYHICRIRKFTEEETKFFISCLLLGLEYIHGNNIIHRDIKPENLVSDENGYIRITDFGVAKINKKDNSNETSGTPGYMAPEVLLGKNHSFTVDFFAIGVMGYEFMLGTRPYNGKDRKAIKQMFLQKQEKINENEVDWSPTSVDFINKCLKRKSTKRLGYKEGVKELINHKWFEGFDWEGLYNKTIMAPFVPKKEGNYDKRYCELAEKNGDQTLERYNNYYKCSNYDKLFEGYTYINLNFIIPQNINPCETHTRFTTNTKQNKQKNENINNMLNNNNNILNKKEMLINNNENNYNIINNNNNIINNTIKNKHLNKNNFIINNFNNPNLNIFSHSSSALIFQNNLGALKNLSNNFSEAIISPINYYKEIKMKSNSIFNSINKNAKSQDKEKNKSISNDKDKFFCINEINQNGNKDLNNNELNKLNNKEKEKKAKDSFFFRNFINNQQNDKKIKLVIIF